MSSSGGSTSSGRGCCSTSITDEDDRRDDDDVDDCLDDWEAMADALAADEIEKNCNDLDLESVVQEKEPEPEVVLTTTAGCRARTSFRAWRPDDVSRPQCLPKMLKQNSFPMKTGVCHGVGGVPSPCHICCEDLDMTDASFLPCPCGYRLCLFCHKRILKDNGHCSSCRKPCDQPDTKNTPLIVMTTMVFARVVGDCAIYVRDKPGHHDFNLLKKLVLPDGSTLRAKLPGRPPTRDCLFIDPIRDGKSLCLDLESEQFYRSCGSFQMLGSRVV